MRQKDKERLDFICIEHTGFNFSDVSSKGVNYTTMEKIIARYTEEIRKSCEDNFISSAETIIENKMPLEKKDAENETSKPPFITSFHEWIRKKFQK